MLYTKEKTVRTWEIPIPIARTALKQKNFYHTKNVIFCKFVNTMM